MLTTETSSASDDNGLPNIVFSYQWVGDANGTSTDIPIGATLDVLPFFNVVRMVRQSHVMVHKTW